MSINVNRIPTITIGFSGENFVTEISFNYSQWASLYGEGTLTLEYKRYGDAVPYPVTLEHDTENHTAKWIISDIDVAKAGVGEGQLIYIIAGAIIKKSAVFNIAVNRSIAEGATPPDPYQSWVDEIIEIADGVQENAELVAGYVNDAEAYARQASASAESALASAESASRDSQSASESASTASGAATNAAQSAQSANTSAQNASASASNANTSAGNARQSEQNAKTSEDNAKESEEQAREYAEMLEPIYYTDENDDGNIVIRKGE